MNNAAFLLISCLISFAQTTAPSNALSSLDQALIANSTAVLEAQKTKGVAFLERLLAPDFQFVNSAGKLQKPDDLLDDAKDGKLRYYRIYDAQVLPVDDTTRIVTFNAIIDKPEGDDYLEPRYQRFSDLWVKQGDQWRLKFEQSSAIRHID